MLLRRSATTKCCIETLRVVACEASNRRWAVVVDGRSAMVERRVTLTYGS